MTEEITTTNGLSIIENINLQSIDKTLSRIHQLQILLQKSLKSGHDYGIIPGTDKPTLLKPGSEKILMLLGLTSEYHVIDHQQNFVDGFFAFTVRCVLYRGDQKITEGLGHANTLERRYTEKKDPNKKGHDPYTLANTVLKMAKKRSQIDAVLTVSSLSEVFTQDMEDLVPFDNNHENSQQPHQQQESARHYEENLATHPQQKAIYAIAKKRNIDLASLLNQYGVRATTDLTKTQASEIISKLQEEEDQDVPF